MSYVPPAGKWESRPPAELGLRADGLAAAVAYHRAHESQWARDFMTRSGRFIGVADEPADSEVLGPVKPREDPNGLVIRHGYIAAEWGDTARSDMSFSIAKSYLSIVAGLAVAAGLIRDLDDPVSDVQARRCVRLAAQPGDHLAPSAAADERVAGHAVGQAGHDRPQPRSRPERARPRRQGPGASAEGARHVLGIQRRPRQSPEPLPAAALPPPAGRRAARGGDGSDRRQRRLVLAALRQLLDRVRRHAPAVGAGRLALGRRPLDVEPRSRAARAARAAAGACGASAACSTRRGWRNRASRARSTRSTGCCGG